MISDQRLLKFTKDIENPLDKILKLEGKVHHRTPTLKEPILVAQEVLPTIPEVILGEYGDVLSVNYVGLVPYLIGAIKEQQRGIENLKEELLKLKKQ